jgi:adenylate cyclase
MSVEIERKFLVHGTAWKAQGTTVAIRQGYLSPHPDRTVRVRVEDETATLTIKGRSHGAVRGEWEYPIPREDAEALLNELCERPLIEKTRTRIAHAGILWEVDEFSGDNLGLVVAEIELESEEQAFEKPDWIGDEVTHDARYFNSSLMKHPYRAW